MKTIMLIITMFLLCITVDAQSLPDYSKTRPQSTNSSVTIRTSTGTQHTQMLTTPRQTNINSNNVNSNVGNVYQQQVIQTPVVQPTVQPITQPQPVRIEQPITTSPGQPWYTR